jgi:putative endonuclease
MLFFVYIIQSQTTGRYYCGQSSDPARRLRQHNDPYYQLSKTTKRFKGPWKLIWSHECPDRRQATRLERSIKGRGVKRYLDELNPPRAGQARQSPALGRINPAYSGILLYKPFRLLFFPVLNNTLPREMKPPPPSFPVLCSGIFNG